MSADAFGACLCSRRDVFVALYSDESRSVRRMSDEQLTETTALWIFISKKERAGTSDRKLESRWLGGRSCGRISSNQEQVCHEHRAYRS
mmetsp:Transcript_15837/g.39234  ORF Transcript_15837/g.39234 Transcript_15837/m.39234 type:complete len:89 (+) Transcript_15837:196-462(+)